jgi:uncharacterized protein
VHPAEAFHQAEVLLVPDAVRSETSQSTSAQKVYIHPAEEELLRALGRAESTPGWSFVSLKKFRDEILPSEDVPSIRSDVERQNVLRTAIDKRLILRGKVQNPKSPQFPVTSIRLNRLMPEVQAVLGRPKADLDFHPIHIKGEPLSATILRERRWGLALYYLETSALVKLYVYELGTERLLALTAGDAGHRFAILSLAQVELRSAIRRRQRGGEIPSHAADELIEAFRRHSEGKFLVQPLSDSLLDIALALVDGYALRGYDAVQLAGYLLLRSTSGAEEPTFVCADRALLLAAVNEGCPVLDPCST